jgi:hypothetical protein
MIPRPAGSGRVLDLNERTIRSYAVKGILGILFAEAIVIKRAKHTITQMPG